MTKVLFISYNGILEHLSQSQVIPYLAGLSREGIKFTLLSYEKREDCEDKKSIVSLREYFKNTNIRWYYLTYHKKPGLLAKLFDMSQGISYSFYLAVAHRVNIVHARSTMPAAIAFIVAKSLRIKFIFDMRGLLAEEYVDGKLWSRPSFKYKLVNRLEKMLLSYADAIVVLTNKINNIFINSDYFRGANEAKINVIPCCVDLKKFKYTFVKDAVLLEKLNLSGKFIFVYIGSLGTWYMLEEMLDFFLEAKKLIAHAHFLILTQSGRGFINNIISGKGLDKDDVTVATVRSALMPDFIALADAGIFFIKPSFSKQASSPTKLGEFLACGIPVVINPGVGDTEEMVNSNKVGVSVKSFTESSYRISIQELFELLKEKYSLRIRCRHTAESFLSLEQGVDKYARLYNCLN